MSDKKDDTSSKDKSRDKKPAADFPLTLGEFCTRISLNDKRVELIGGFHATEKAAGNMSDTEANFKKRLVKFETKPVA